MAARELPGERHRLDQGAVPSRLARREIVVATALLIEIGGCRAFEEHRLESEHQALVFRQAVLAGTTYQDDPNVLDLRRLKAEHQIGHGGLGLIARAGQATVERCDLPRALVVCPGDLEHEVGVRTDAPFAPRDLARVVANRREDTILGGADWMLRVAQ